MVPCVFTAKANMVHAVFLQEVLRWSLCSELLREVAYVCEPESLDAKRRIDCGGMGQLILLYSVDRKHLLCK